tara:strand:+ start:9327 stop:9752 length:426 start_codon:yes stop_codon:yes gene_type:complete
MRAGSVKIVGLKEEIERLQGLHPRVTRDVLEQTITALTSNTSEGAGAIPVSTGSYAKSFSVSNMAGRPRYSNPEGKPKGQDQTIFRGIAEANMRNDLEKIDFNKDFFTIRNSAKYADDVESKHLVFASIRDLMGNAEVEIS